MSYRDIDYDNTSQVGRICKEMAKDFVEGVYAEQVVDIENCAFYDTWDDYFGFDLDDDEADFIFAVDRKAKVEVKVTW